MSQTPTIQVGDWIRFYQGGRLVIAEVSYVRTPKYYPHEPEALTELGTTRCSDVVEVRRVAK